MLLLVFKLFLVFFDTPFTKDINRIQKETVGQNKISSRILVSVVFPENIEKT